MNKTTSIIIGVIVIAIVAVGAFLGMNYKSSKVEAPLETQSAEAKKDSGDVPITADVKIRKGSYEVYAPEKLALAEKGKVVLYFKASWCPICRAFDAHIRANIENIPEGVAILYIDYDTSTALKQKYGVTYQHTFVQVDPSGKQLAKWSGSRTLTELVSTIK